jgi:hypothetical protein
MPRAFLFVASPLLSVHVERVMQSKTGRVIVGFLWLAILIIVASAWSAGARSGAAKARVPPRNIVAAKPIVDNGRAASIPLPGLQEESPDRRVDLYGNDVEVAVSDYRVDLYGVMYERHSPETELPRLAAPAM